MNGNSVAEVVPISPLSAVLAGHHVLPHLLGPRDHAAPQVLWAPVDGHGQAEAVHRGGGDLYG